MARVFPSRLPGLAREDPLRKGECLLYDVLSQMLDDSYRVFYSVAWITERTGAQPRRNKYGLRKKLESMPGGRRGMLEFGHAVAFPDCPPNPGVLRPDVPREIVVFSEDLDWLDTKVEAMFDYWAAESGARSGNVAVEDADVVVGH